MQIMEQILRDIRDDARIEEVRRGLHWTAVVSRRCGLASTMFQEFCNNEEDGPASPKGSLTEMSALELARLSLSDDISRTPLGLAAINSLLEVDVENLPDTDGLQLVYDLGKEKNISVIGHFPFLDRLRGVARNLWIIEKHPRPGDISEEKGREYIPQSDIVVISGTTLINHTLSGILALCKERSVRMLLGPSTPMTPVLFDYGLDILSGSVVTDTAVVLKHVSEGANFVRLKKTGAVRFVTMVKDYAEMVEKLK